MASKMFGAMAANCLRSAIHPMPSAKSSMVVGGTTRGMIQGSGIWEFLAVASSPFAVGLVWNNIVIAAEAGSAVSVYLFASVAAGSYAGHEF